MSLADELLADLEDQGGNDENMESKEEGASVSQPGPSNEEDSDAEMANGDEEEVRTGLVLEGMYLPLSYSGFCID